MNSALSLYELNNLVRRTLECTLSDTYWVQAELSEVRESGGHCFMEFVQKQVRGNAIIAKARAQIWASRWGFLRSYFMRTTGQSLHSGIQVLVEVQVTFHEAYGYSLNVVDIDPTYTLGDIARRRQEILKVLEDEGVMEMNKELPLPRLLQRIAVVSSASAAGYGDFCNQLLGNAHGLHFDVQLFPAIMQGDGVEASVISALNSIADSLDQWDVVVIIRGGGATSDLSGFDTLALAENVAQFPLPVITGIGHERDDTIIDMVSHTRVKTPTAAAEFLIQHQKEQFDLVCDMLSVVETYVDDRLADEHLRFTRLVSKLPSLMTMLKSREEARVDRLTRRAVLASASAVDDGRRDVERLHSRLLGATQIYMLRQSNRLHLLEQQVTSADPARIFRLGYSVARLNGKAVTEASSLRDGDMISIELANGTVDAVVKK